MTVPVKINGEDTSVAEGITVAEIVAARRGPRSSADRRRGVAVAVNGEVVPRSEWSATRLGPDDVVEILNAVGGG
jgi:sulfur carrier protein